MAAESQRAGPGDAADGQARPRATAELTSRAGCGYQGDGSASRNSRSRSADTAPTTSPTGLPWTKAISVGIERTLQACAAAGSLSTSIFRRCQTPGFRGSSRASLSIITRSGADQVAQKSARKTRSFCAAISSSRALGSFVQKPVRASGAVAKGDPGAHGCCSLATMFFWTNTFGEQPSQPDRLVPRTTTRTEARTVGPLYRRARGRRSRLPPSLRFALLEAVACHGPGWPSPDVRLPVQRAFPATPVQHAGGAALTAPARLDTLTTQLGSRQGAPRGGAAGRTGGPGGLDHCPFESVRLDWATIALATSARHGQPDDGEATESADVRTPPISIGQ
jgi:hypothetical protein